MNSVDRSATGLGPPGAAITPAAGEGRMLRPSSTLVQGRWSRPRRSGRARRRRRATGPPGIRWSVHHVPIPARPGGATPWSTAGSAGPDATSASSASGRGRSAATGAPSTTRTACAPCTRPRTRASTLIDTADVYGDGRQRAADRAVPARAAAASRSSSPPRWAAACRSTSADYTPEAFRAWMDRSRENLGVETAGPRPAPLPADAGLLPARGVRRARRAGRPSGGSPPTG